MLFNSSVLPTEGTSKCVRFEVHSAVTMKTTVFCTAPLYNLVVSDVKFSRLIFGENILENITENILRPERF
jgi:hypothetical protein